MLKLVQCYDKSEAGIVLTSSAKGMTFVYSLPSQSVEIKVTTQSYIGDSESDFNPDFTIRLNLAYFIDAIELAVKDRGVASFDISNYGELLPIVISHSLGNAMIMPMRQPC